MSDKTIPQLIYETMGNDSADAASIIGITERDLYARRQILIQFLETSEWDEQKYRSFYAEQMDLMLRQLHNKQLPSNMQVAKNFLTAVASHISHGWTKCTKEESDSRYAICRECERMRDDGRCAICGCFMDIKSTWKEQKCPIAKW